MNRTPRSRWLNATVLGIGLASLSSDLSHEAVTALLPALLATMGSAAGILGLIEGTADALSTSAKLFGGWWADRLEHRKPLCAAGYAAMTLGTGVIAAASTWPMLLLGRSAAWLARGLRTPARKVLLAEAVTPATYGRAFGFERAMDTAGAVAAPAIAMLLLNLGLTHRAVVWLSVVPALAATVAIILLVRERGDRVRERAPLVASLRNVPRPFARFLRAVGLFGAGDFSHTLMILYATSALTESLGAQRAATAAIALYTLHNVAYAAISYPAGILADRVEKRRLLAAGYAAGAATALLLASGVAGLPFLALAFVLGGAYVGIEETVEDSIAAELLPAPIRGSGFGLLAAVNGLGDFVSSLAVGWLWTAVGPGAAFASAAVTMAAGAWLAWRTGDTGRPGARS